MITSRSQLGDLMKTLGLPMVAAELGVAEGRYSLEMLQWGMEKLYLVDLWRHVDGMTAELGDPAWDHDVAFRASMDLVKPYQQRVVVLKGWAHEMAKEVSDESLGMVYEDATHKQEWVLKNAEAWYPKLVPGGIYAGHDYLNPGLTVKPAADEFAAHVGAELHVLPEHKIDDASFYFLKPT